jgi:hypothetical protein
VTIDKTIDLKNKEKVNKEYWFINIKMTINLLEPKYKLVIKLIGIALIIMAAVAYGEYKYVIGRSDQCLDDHGYLLNINNSYSCKNESYFNEKGYKIDYQNRRLISNQGYMPYNLSDLPTWN